MILLELDLEKISRMAERKEKENLDFRIYLKGQDPGKIDKMVHRLNKLIVEQIDCTQCGNCCKTTSTSISDSELLILAELENLSAAEFETRFVEKDELDNEKFLKDIPCKYLSDKKCTIYENRPEDCRSYPHTHKNRFVSRTLGVLINYEICPIVYNVYENLKIELNYKSRYR